MMRFRLVVPAMILAGLFGGSLAAQQPTEQPGAPAVRAAFAKLPLAFVRNEGQWSPDVRFMGRRDGLTVRLERDAMVVRVDGSPRSATVRLAFEGCSKNAGPHGEQPLPGRYSFFVGNDRDRWASGVRSFAAVCYRELYDGVDVRLREGEGGIFEYDVLVAPGAELGGVTVRCGGVDALRLADDGALVLDTPAGPLTMKAPVTWEEGPAHQRVPVACRYRLLGENRFGFDAPGRRPDRKLVVDPGLVFSAYLGGSSPGEWVSDLAVAANGEVTVVGDTDSSDFPTTADAFDRTYNAGGNDVYVARLSASGSSLVWATFLGGQSTEQAWGVAIEPSGGAVVVGTTASTDFPTTPGALQTTTRWGNAFVTRISPTGTSLVYSTYFGGISDPGVWCRAVAVDSTGSAYVTGTATSSSFPTTPGAYSRTFRGFIKGYVSRISPDGSTLVYSTFLGGGSGEHLNDLTIDGAGEATVVGDAASTDFPTTPGAYRRVHAGGLTDGVVTRLAANGASLVYSTYLGGSDNDSCSDVVLGPGGEAFLVGRTRSADFPTTAGAFDRTHNGPAPRGWDVFVARLSPSGSALAYSTFLGGSSDEGGRENITVDPTDIATVVGQTRSIDFPTTPNALDTTLSGSGDGFVVQLTADGSQLVYATFLGGASVDGAQAVGLDAKGRPVVGGSTGSSDFPTTPGAFQTALSGSGDAFVAKLAITSLQGSGAAKPGTTVNLAISAPEDSGLRYQLGSSFGTGPIPIGTRKLGLSPDNLLVLSLSGLVPSIFSSYAGVIGPNGQATAAINIPNWSVLVGNTIHTAFVTLSASAPQGLKSTSNTFSFQIQ